jgi:hypothetical protein
MQAAPTELDFLNESPFQQTVCLYEAFYGNSGKFNCKKKITLRFLNAKNKSVAKSNADSGLKCKKLLF